MADRVWGNRVSGDITDDATRFLGDPGGYITGTNTEGFGGVKKMLFGDPDAIKEAYEKAMGYADQGAQRITNFLMGQQGKAQQYYAPLSHLFQSTYGTEGLQGPQIPQAQGPGTLSALYGR